MSAAMPLTEFGDPSDCLSGALDCAKRGLRMFPLHSVTDGVCTCQPWRDERREGPCKDEGKHPRFGKWQDRATSDPAVIKRWFRRNPNGSNIGVATGAGSRIFVVDIDPRHDGENSLAALIHQHGRLPDTLQAITGSGGAHYYFAHPGKPVPNLVGLRDGIDVRGDGGFVVAPPSLHKSGRRYSWDGMDGLASPIAPAPTWLVDLIWKHQSALDRPRFQLPAEINEGARNDTLHRYACSLRGSGGGLEYTEILNAASAVNRARCKPPLDEDEVRALVESACKHQKGNSQAAQHVTGVTGSEYLLNDSGNADRLVDAHGRDLIYCPERKGLMVWTGTHWAHDEFVRVERMAESVLRDAFAEAGDIKDEGKRKAFLRFLNQSLQRAGIVNMVHSTKRKVEQLSVNAFDLGPFVLNFENGTVCLKTGVVREHRREERISKCIPFRYDSKAECPTFMGFLYRLMGDHPEASQAERERAERLVRYLQRAFGCAATGKPEKVLFLLFGPAGNNGKTTLVEIIREAFGNREYGGEVQMETLLARAKDAISSNSVNADLADLKGCRFVSASEVDEGQRLNLSRVRYLTGLGQIRARYLHENFFNFKPTHKLFIDCNHKPLIPDRGDAIWNRVKLIPFDVIIPDHQIDTNLPDKLRGELPGIARWIVEGARSYVRHGLLDIPEVRAATEKYRNDSDRITEFIEEKCVLDENATTPVAELWAAYRKWSENSGETFPIGKSMFDERIQRYKAHKDRDTTGTKRIWKGIGLTN